MGPTFGHAADQHHEDRDQRHGHGDQQRRGRVGDEDPDPGCHGHRDREHQRRQELTDVGLQFVDAGGGDVGFAAREPAGRPVAVDPGVVEHGGPHVVADRRHRSARRPLAHPGADRADRRHRAERDEHAGESARDVADLDEFGETVGEQFGLDEYGQRRRDGDSTDDDQVSTEAGEQSEEADVDRPAPVDTGHDRWTTGRCWVPIRLRNTQYVHPWYNSTIGVITMATMVITFKV